MRLGLSQYEAGAYVGLLAQGEQTGYGLANVTGVPQPKIYATLDTSGPWNMYAGDQRAVLNYLGIDRALTLGCSCSRSVAGCAGPGPIGVTR
jgi:hypothetical protein